MLQRGLFVSALLLSPAFSFAASREIQELQRDVAQLQEMVRNLQQSQNERMAALTVLVQQTVDASNKANTQVAVLENGIRQTLRDQEKNVVGPVAGLGTKVDQMATEFQALRESVAAISSQLSKLQVQVVDIGNAVKTIQAPPPPPPAAGMGAAPAAGGLPPVPAGTLYNNAQNDRLGGKPDLALQEFQQYLQYYPQTDLAPNAQYYIGEIHFSQGDLESALREFDLVLEKYPDNAKTPDALFMKGQTLVKLGRRTQGGQEFQELIKRFPNHDLSKKACSQLQTMGLRCGTSRTAPAKTTTKRKK